MAKNPIAQKIADMQDEADQLIEIREDVLWAKSDFTIQTLGFLMEKLNNSIEDILEDRESDKIGATLTDVLKEIKEVFKNFKVPELKQQINFDTKPLLSLNENIKKQNENISELIKKIPQGNNEGGVSRELLQMIARNNEFINKATQQYDYSKVLKEIADGFNRKEEKSEIKFPTLKVERTTGGFIQKLIPVT